MEGFVGLPLSLNGPSCILVRCSFVKKRVIWEESTELPWGGGADSESGTEAEYSEVQRVGVGYGSEAKSSGAQEAGTSAEAGFLKAGEVGAEAGTCDVSLDSIEGAGILEVYGKGGIPGMGGGRAPPQLHWDGRAAGGKAPGASGGWAAGGKWWKGQPLILAVEAILLKGPSLFSLLFGSPLGFLMF